MVRTKVFYNTDDRDKFESCLRTCRIFYHTRTVCSYHEDYKKYGIPGLKMVWVINYGTIEAIQ